MRWTGRNPRRRVTVGQRPALQPLSSIPGDPVLTVARGASYTMHFTRLTAVLSGAPSLGDTAQLLLDQRVWWRVLHWSGRGWSGEIWGLWRCEGCSRGCGRYHKPSWLSLAYICVCAFVCPQAMAAVTRAIQESGMGLNPEVEGTIIRVPIPKWVFHRPGPESSWPLSPLLLTSLFTRLCLFSPGFLSFQLTPCLAVSLPVCLRSADVC